MEGEEASTGRNGARKGAQISNSSGLTAAAEEQKPGAISAAEGNCELLSPSLCVRWPRVIGQASAARPHTSGACAIGRTQVSERERQGRSGGGV